MALAVALGGTGMLVAAGAAQRTAGAYAAYLERAEVGEVVVNPSLNTADIDTAVRGLPGVRKVTSSVLFFASVGEETPMPRGELETRASAQGQVSGSVDGRFTAMDRPELAAGRFPSGGDEVLVNVEMARARGLAVGDTLPLTFWRSRDDQAAGLDDVIAPVGVVHATVVGIATLPDEVLPDGLFPRERVVVSPATVGGGTEARHATVTGIAVLPPIGQFQADRTAPGTGMVLPLAFQPDAAELITFAGIDVAPDADPADVYADIDDEWATWDLVGTPPVEYRAPVRPPEIVNVQSMRAMPLLVGGLLAATAVIGLTLAVTMSVRSRRRELAILTALGFTRRQTRTSIRVQALATMLAGLLIGAPLGIATGRIAWRAFATRLGVVDNPATPGAWIAAIVAGSLFLTLAAAAVPARTAARSTPATTLRAE